MGEFELIDRFFKRPAKTAVVGIGDDCAVWTPRPGHQLAFSADMLVEGRHFLPTVDPHRLGHKALAVNLSDLAACGATPTAFLLSLSLPHVDELWLSGFASGLFQLADTFGCELIGGDTTQGPLNVAITVMGEVPKGQAILRSGALPGDDIYVSGFVGDARLALECFRGKISLPQSVFESARMRMECPIPRVELGKALLGVATSMADISDGLLGDLTHILRASHVGADLEWPLTSRLLAANATWSCPEALQQTCVLSGGDDYELVFTAPVCAASHVEAAAHATQTPVTRIGSITQGLVTTLRDATGAPITTPFASFDHFA